MDRLFAGLGAAIRQAQETRDRHRRRQAPGRSRDLKVALAALEQHSEAVRQEQSRNARDTARRRAYGAELTRLSRQAQYERHALRRMIANDV